MGSARCRQDVGSHSHLLLIADGGFIKPNPVMATFGAALLGLKDHRSAGCNCDHPPPRRPSSTDGTENVHLLTWGPLSWKTGLIPIRGYDCPILSGNTAAHKAHRLVSRSSLTCFNIEHLEFQWFKKVWGSLNPEKYYFLDEKHYNINKFEREKKSVHIILHFFLYDTNDKFFWWSIEIPTLTYGHHHQEEAKRKTQDLLGELQYISRLAWEHLGIPLVELEEGRGRGKSDSYSTLVTQPPRKRRENWQTSCFKCTFFFKPYDGLMITSWMLKGQTVHFPVIPIFRHCYALVSTNPTSQSILNSAHLVLRMGLNAACGSILCKQILPTDSLHGPEPNASWGLFPCVCSAV